ncbi:MAG: glycosyltransferase [Prevotellaceae bacterium]|jgi:uncharacterized protein (TIGR00661 family)|nr:glycosyltransferase [Prevotellaceae bacterium]
MKYLFIAQGEGRGHLTQAIAMYSLLTNGGHEVVETLVGKNRQAELPAFFYEKMQPCPVSTFESPHFLFSSRSKKSLFWRSIAHSLLKLPAYLKSIAFINRRIAASNADAVINFYEILTGLTYALCRPQKPCVCVAHQYLFLHSGFAFPKKSRLKIAALLLFTRLTAVNARRLLALSFREMPREGKIYVTPPLLRSEALRQTARSEGYILGYLLHAGLAEEVAAWHRQHPDIPLHFFWGKKGAPAELREDENLVFHQLDDAAFLGYMARCRAYAATGGFESICEAMYLQKPVLMVPMHIEQECNAFDAVSAGAGVASPVFDLTTLVAYLPTYRPNPDFAAWVSRTSRLVAEALAFSAQ